MKAYHIAHAAGITPAHLSQIIHGKKRPSWKVAKKLANVTKTNPVMWMDEDHKIIRSAVFAFIQSQNPIPVSTT